MKIAETERERNSVSQIADKESSCVPMLLLLLLLLIIGAVRPVDEPESSFFIFSFLSSAGRITSASFCASSSSWSCAFHLLLVSNAALLL